MRCYPETVGRKKPGMHEPGWRGPDFRSLTLKARLPATLGYLLAGLLIGHTPDRAIAGQLAEIGVALLMFGAGLHFDPKGSARGRRIAIGALSAGQPVPSGLATSAHGRSA